MSSGHLESMRFHLSAMEARNKILEQMEKAALHKAKESARGRAMSTLGRATPAEYRAKVLLEDDWWFKKIANERDGHRRTAEVYALAALAEATTVNP